MNIQAQGAIEYLLIIAAAILVVAIVILAVTGALAGGEAQVSLGQETIQNAMDALEVQAELAKGNIQITNDTLPTTWDEGKTYFLSENIVLNDKWTIQSTTGITLDCKGRSISLKTPTPPTVLHNS
jgi:uncharacterized protein (UPF0333 family)